MAKANNNVENAQGAEATTTAIETFNSSTELTSLDANKLQELQEYFELFEAKDSQEMRSLTSEYLKLEENKVYNFVFTGMTTFTTDQGEEKEAAVLVDKANATFISGAAVLVNAFKKIKEVPSFVRIVTGSKQKGANGSYLAMEVKTL
jgi:hypothetical protein